MEPAAAAGIRMTRYDDAHRASGPLDRFDGLSSSVGVAICPPVAARSYPGRQGRVPIGPQLVRTPRNGENNGPYAVQQSATGARYALEKSTQRRGAGSFCPAWRRSLDSRKSGWRAGLRARTNALMNLPCTFGATASASMPAAPKNFRASWTA